MKSTFQNQAFYNIVLAGLCILLCWNLVILVLTSQMLLLLALVLQVSLLFLLLTKHQYARLGLLTLAVLWIAGPALSITGSVLKLFTGEDPANLILPLTGRLLILFLGMTLYHYTKTTVVVEGDAVMR